MTDEKRLYRSRDALVGGVCAGIADYFDIDPLIARILTIVFTLASGGLLAIAYVALWIAVPKKPTSFAPLDVEPQEVRSDTYGTVGRGESSAPFASGPTTPAAAAGQRYVSRDYPGSGHVPPEPPAAAAWSPPPPASPGAAGAPQPADRPPAAAPAWACWPTDQRQPVAPCKEPSSAKVKAALVAGSFLLFFGIGMLASEFVVGVSWWQCWPIVLLIFGIVRMVLPDQNGWSLGGFSKGLVLFSLGATLLPMSVGVVAWSSIGLMAEYLWPMLCIAIGFLVLGCALKSSALKLAAALTFVAFCVAGILWCSVPGPAQEIVLMAPYGREYRFLFFQ